MIFQNMDRIVFAGDSVTDMGSANPVGEGLFENLGHGYVRMVENLLVSCYPDVKLRITNSGISGHTSRDLLARFDRDVVQLNPDWVAICIGINDVWRQFDVPAISDSQVMPEEYEQNVDEMIQKVKGTAKGIFLLTPYYMEPNCTDWMRAYERIRGHLPQACQKARVHSGGFSGYVRSLFPAPTFLLHCLGSRASQHDGRHTDGEGISKAL